MDEYPYGQDFLDPRLELASGTSRHPSVDDGNTDDDRIVGEYYDDYGSDVSDADSDKLELQADMAKLDAIRNAFLTEQRSGENSSHIPVNESVRGPRKGRKLGPRKAAAIPPDIKHRLTHATEAFTDGDFDHCMAILFEIIRHNAEIEDAWRLLSSVLEAFGRRDEAVMCLVYAAHLSPRSVKAWLGAAELALDGLDTKTDEQERAAALLTASLCYSAAVRAEPRSIKARTGKADVFLAQGHATLAVKEYMRILKHKPFDIFTIRNLSDASLDVKATADAVEKTKAAYRAVIDHCLAGGSLEGDAEFVWSDVRIYMALFESLEQWEGAILELRRLSRWFLGRRDEEYWDRWMDDREWDRDDEPRRVEVPDFEAGRYSQGQYGLGLPIDLRAKLFVYRSKIGADPRQAEAHREWLDPAEHSTLETVGPFASWLKDVADQLLEEEDFAEAGRYYAVYRRIAAEDENLPVEPDMLVSQGRCYLALDDKAAAEECFIAAIDVDEDNIDARYELAKMYEGEETTEAFILVNEALSLEAAQEGLSEEELKRQKYRRLVLQGFGRPGGKGVRRQRPPGEARKYERRRLLEPSQRQKYEEQRAESLKEKYRVCQELKGRIGTDDEMAIETWMAAAKELTDDFRSFKEFYPWDKYLRFLGYSSLFERKDVYASKQSDLAAMAARLRQNLAPVEEQDMEAQALRLKDHRGIPFDEWLDIFLEYAISLAHAHEAQEAYAVLHSARDSVVYKSRENAFLIHVTWGSCALYVGDEETCVAVARFFMKEYAFSTDAYRMFATLSRLCQSPVSWYSSGPAQKYILRQIKLMDQTIRHPEFRQPNDGLDHVTRPDVALLMVYGHILFSSTSYTYALNYFMRAASIEPDNPLVNLSTGLSYIHFALKRQSANRQYLLMQGFAFLFKYHAVRAASPRLSERQEAHFNIARGYHLVGLAPLAVEYYRRVLLEGGEGAAAGADSDMGREDLVLEAALNVRSQCLIVGDVDGARAVTERWLVL